MNKGVVINEVYLSVQGESTWAGLACVFVRLTGCHLRCSYCDTAYAFREGTRWSLEEVLRRVGELSSGYMHAVTRWRLPLVEITGGEPLLQPAVFPLMKALCDEGYVVLVETGGAADIGGVDPRVRRIMDLKCPSSGECERNRWENLAHLTDSDEVKFVVGTIQDYEWMKRVIDEHELAARCALLVSWVTPLTAAQRDASLRPVPAGQTPMSRRELVERLVTDALPVRYQVQMHKVIWPAEERGV